MKYDLLIKGGTLVDPAQGIHQANDVAFAAGKVAAVGPDLAKTESREVIDAGGKIVTPGLIDLHVHVFYGVSHFGVEPDPTCVARGTTTVPVQGPGMPMKISSSGAKSRLSGSVKPLRLVRILPSPPRMPSLPVPP